MRVFARHKSREVRLRNARMKGITRFCLAAALGLLIPGLALVAGTGIAAATTRPGHSIATAGTLTMGPTAAGGGGAIDFWKVNLSGGDVVQLLTTTPPATPQNVTTVYNFELFPPGTTDASFPNVPPVSSANTFGNTTDVLNLQAPYNGTFILAVCENTNGDCRSVDSSGGLNPMQSYSFTPTLVGGGIPARVAAKETRAATTIAHAPRIGVGNFEAGGGNLIDFWKVTLSGGDVVQLTTKTPSGTPQNVTTAYNFELFPPGTTDTSFPTVPPVSSANTFGNTTDTLNLQAPYNGTFILAVCENTNGDCRSVDSNSGLNPMQPYTFTPTLVHGGIPARVAARETRAATTIARAPRIGVGNFEAGGGNLIDFWRVSLNKGDRVQLATTTPSGTPQNVTTVYNFELFLPGTTDGSFPQRPPVAAANTFGNTTDTLVLTAPRTGTFVFAVCENTNGDCRGVDSSSGLDPMQPYTFTTRLIGGKETQVSLKLSASAVTFGHEKSLKFSATVRALFGGRPTGKVAISDGKKTVCTVKLVNGKGTCSPSSSTLIPAGKYSITGSYSGNFLSSRSAPVALTVKK
jgi:Bacterial Ig-like domain (group 3)